MILLPIDRFSGSGHHKELHLKVKDHQVMVKVVLSTMVCIKMAPKMAVKRLTMVIVTSTWGKIMILAFIESCFGSGHHNKAI